MIVFKFVVLVKIYCKLINNVDDKRNLYQNLAI